MAQPDRVDPIHQFAVTPIVDFGTIGGMQLAFTNSSLYMVITVVLITGFMVAAASPGALVPGRLQSLGEIAYEFVANMLRDSAGRKETAQALAEAQARNRAALRAIL